MSSEPAQCPAEVVGGHLYLVLRCTRGFRAGAIAELEQLSAELPSEHPRKQVVAALLGAVRAGAWKAPLPSGQTRPLVRTGQAAKSRARAGLEAE